MTVIIKKCYFLIGKTLFLQIDITRNISLFSCYFSKFALFVHLISEFVCTNLLRSIRDIPYYTQIYKQIQTQYMKWERAADRETDRERDRETERVRDRESEIAWALIISANRDRFEHSNCWCCLSCIIILIFRQSRSTSF